MKEDVIIPINPYLPLIEHLRGWWVYTNCEK
jgi:hypothetical protein